MTTETTLFTENVSSFMCLLVSYWGTDGSLIVNIFKQNFIRKKLTYPSTSNWHKFKTYYSKKQNLDFLNVLIN